MAAVSGVAPFHAHRVWRCPCVLGSGGPGVWGGGLACFRGDLPFSKTSFNIWKFMVQILLKSGLENFEHYFASV